MGKNSLLLACILLLNAFCSVGLASTSINKQDSLQADQLNKLVNEVYLYNNLDSAIFYNTKLARFSKQKKASYWECQASYNFGKIYSLKGDNLKSLFFHRRSFEIADSIGDNLMLANAQKSIGVIYGKQGNIGLALKNLEQCIQTFEKLGNVKGALNCLLNISIIQNENNNPIAGRQYCLEVISRVRSENLDYNLANTYLILAMGSINYKPDTSLVLLEESSQILKQDGDTIGLIDIRRAQGEIYMVQKDFDKALLAYLDVIRAKQSINTYDGLPDLYSKVAQIQLEKGQNKKALKNILKAKQLLPKANDIEEVLVVYKILARAYKQNGNFRLANSSLEQYYATRDSLESETNEKLLVKQELKHEFDKQIFADSVKNNAKLILKETEIAKERVLREKSQDRNLYLGLIIFLVACSTLFILNRFRISNKQKKKIQEQKILVDSAFDKIAEKNTEILDSMTYAKRIQTAMLPDANLLTKALPNSFVLYLPKDIISGDFYWLEHKSDEILFAVADCTGHGIPGAMVSVLCNNSMNRAVQLSNSDPAEILNDTRAILIHELDNDDTLLKDGMDIALCKLVGNDLYYAGANNPLWYIRDGELIEVKADRQPIANHDHIRPFTTHHIKVQKNDMIYLFTDGYVDQFGGSKNKKFKYSQLRKLLVENSQFSVEKQKKFLESTLINWRGNNEQVDDICIMGIRI